MTKYTDRIEQFLDGEMTAEQEAAFKAQVKTDRDLAREVEAHLLATEGIQYFQETKEIKAEKSKVSTSSATEKLSRAAIENQKIIKKPKRSDNIRRLLAIAASFLLLILAYFMIPKSPHSPMAETTTQIIKFESGTRGENTTKTPLQQGIEYFGKEEYENAIPLFDQTIRENPNRRAEAQFLKADALHRMDKKPEAKAVLQSITKTDNEQYYNKAQSILEKY